MFIDCLPVAHLMLVGWQNFSDNFPNFPAELCPSGVCQKNNLKNQSSIIFTPMAAYTFQMLLKTLVLTLFKTLILII